MNDKQLTILSSDLKEIKYAKSLLESKNFTVQITNLIGKPIEQRIDQLPEKIQMIIKQATNKALQISLKIATSTMQNKAPESSSDIIHKLASATSGAGGGFFGITALPLELPVSTTIIIRSIMDIARSEGEDIGSVEVQLACIEVFALGGSSKNQDKIDTGYFTVRTMLSNTLSEAVQHITKQGLANKSAPIIVKLISEISSQFSLQVSQKVLLQSIPIIGAASGALVNTLFIDYFQNIAKGHFIIRRMEHKYSESIVKKAYQDT